jgi:hypothetical protein
MTFNARFLDARQNEVQRTSHFKIAIEGFDEEFLLHVRTANLMDKSFQQIETPFFNDRVKQAGTRSFADMSVEVHDAIGPDVERRIHEWQEQIMNSNTGFMGYAADYKRSAKITEYNINGEIRSVYQYEGVWPMRVDYGSLSREDVNKKSVSMTLSYDRAKLLSISEA